MSDIVKYEVRGNTALITVDNPPVNALSAAVRKGTQDAFNRAARDADVKAVVLQCAGRTFFSGADITEFGKPMQQPALPGMLATMDALEKPIVAAMHGITLGGGLEAAMNCHYRIALSDAKAGLPEVKLGLIPGAGGTQLLPRLIGIEAALDIIVSGRQIKAAEALKLGLIDRIADSGLTDAALSYAQELIETKAVVKRCSEMTIPEPIPDSAWFDQYRATVAKKARGYEAPQACIDAVQMSLTEPYPSGLVKERESFMTLMAGSQSGSQRHLFFANRQAATVDGIDKSTPVRNIKKVGVIGAGTMGTGIAMNFLNAGIPVTILEVQQDALDRGLGTINRYYDSRISKGRLSKEQANHARNLATGTLDYNDLSDVDLVIEAVFESMDIKHKVFGKLDEVCKPGAILASNTSSLDIDQIATATKRPEDVLGLHFFSPAQVMRLLEVVRAEKTSPDALATVMKLARTIGKVGVVSGVCDGFIGNRMLKGYGREAGALLLEGATPAQVDSAMYTFGMAMGPLAMGDLAGLDIGYSVRKERRARGETVPAADGAVADRLVEMGRKGQKTAKGYYRYEEGSRLPLPDPDVDLLIRETASDLGITPRNITEEEIVERLIYPLINEAALILEEGIAQRPGDIDVVWTNGYGFPIFRGGPMFYADTVGLEKILTSIKRYEVQYGDIWTPAPLLVKLVDEGKSFASL